ncbi:molybdopterin synthase catalytic subunit MoaE [Pigmentiphaga sp.]|uniref:molybdopterin synthase catalytic subunit MoaE n=1 Tax=Pigmentiphaga sp. TaxID=1977564 RepID=UPI00128AE41D|nr:molybdopterin synthase catalytic subunit MoaE [Pigmentiphaga sp.]MPS30598.1 molybdopterin synthase catalytic subunit MoaE [Alcaligenaceae bacterium SAGV5]MPS53615.1 molybdopterin synthase catalytic subunit MoaE [Alcaligenaceae bacterium SAGV3]MPT57964.1 molybdopterin synthase catalytic subunit MoaE [Alcaligenaceae bacterium]
MTVSVQTRDFDAGAEISVLRADSSVGAIVTFIGTVRDINEGDAVASMTLEHYPGMTEKALAGIVDEARRRWTLNAVRVIHRVGTLRACDQIVFVGVAGRHRGECFAACEFIMDYLKTQAPFWKKEATGHGERWVEARESDDEALRRWERGEG